MAKNENTSLKNRHSLYLAKSGYGKSQTLIRKGGIPKSGARVVLWDNNRDHPAHQYSSLAEFMRALARADKSGRGFRIAYTGDASPAAFEVWAHGVWEILDGNRETFALIEEYSDCCAGAGPLSQKTAFYHRRLWTQGRKYGGIIHSTSQRPQLISKDALGNAGVIWASTMDMSAAKRVAAEMDLRPEDLRGCGVGEFFYRDNGAPAQKMKVFVPLEAK